MEDLVNVRVAFMCCFKSDASRILIFACVAGSESRKNKDTTGIFTNLIAELVAGKLQKHIFQGCALEGEFFDF